MTAPMISVSGLGKRYRIGAQGDLGDGLRHVLTNLLQHPLRKRPREYFWALQDATFDVQEGEVLGIIGRNGAGKSTLLKLLSKITEPTTGEARLRGRVASLLEVGTGFHPELTGRENIYMNGAILGMSQREINHKFDEIVAFSEIERFLDTPVKRYSSGMYVRLAFSVAAHLEPEILLIDEVLAVGDLPFQRKCLGKMKDVAEGGRTVLFVSHNMGAIRNLCHQGIVLRNGQLVGEKMPVTEAVDLYLAQNATTAARYEAEADTTARAAIRSIAVRSAQSDKGPFPVEQPLAIDLTTHSRVPYDTLRISLYLTNGSGTIVLFSDVDDTLTTGLGFAGEARFTVQVPGQLLAQDRYTVTVGIKPKMGGEQLAHVANAAQFELLDFSTTQRAARPGVLSTKLAWECTPGEGSA